MPEHKTQRRIAKSVRLARSARPRKRRHGDHDESLSSASLVKTDAAGPSQVTIRQLQSQLGNRRVYRLLHAPSESIIQRDGGGDIPGVGAPLVGLKRGDGVGFGNEGLRPRVQLLQQKLNEKMLANIEVDGMFGSLTEQSLREFQESEDLAPGPVIDPQTADLLMMAHRPSQAPATAPGTSSTSLEERMIPLAGEALTDCFLSVSNGGWDISMAGTHLFDLEDERKSNAGYRLQDAGLMLSEVDTNLRLAAHYMKASQKGSGKVPAGEKLEKAGESLSQSAKPVMTSGEILTGISDPAFQIAGELLKGCSSSFQESSVLLESAGLKLAGGSGESSSIGDPLVGLQRGDGLVAGTLHRQPRVSLLQQKLNERTSAGLIVDGKFGPQTGKALTDFQTSVGQSPQERIDRPTAQALRNTGVSSVPGVGGAGMDLADAGKRLVEASLKLSAAGTSLLAYQQKVFAGRSMVAGGSDLKDAGESMMRAGSFLAPVQP